MKVGRNAPCPCGSGKKYKACCLAKSAPGAPMPLRDKLLIALVGIGLAAGVAALVATLVGRDTQPQRVWSEEHQHWHDL